MKKRVVVTGMGWTTPLGHEIDSVWNKLVNGESGIKTHRRFDATTYTTNFAGEVDESLSLYNVIKNKDSHTNAAAMSRFAIAAAQRAWKHANLDTFKINPARAGVYLGGGEGTLDFEKAAVANLAAFNDKTRSINGSSWFEAADRQLTPSFELEQEPNLSSWHIAQELGLQGPAFSCLTACAASTQAIGEACDIIRRGEADVMVGGGTHTMLHPLGVTGFIRLTALSSNNDDPPGAAKPFSRNRDGFVMGEGSGIVILESLDHALARGAKPLAEVLGYGSSADAYRVTDLHPEGRGPTAAMNAALKEANINPSEKNIHGRPPVQYISAHGTGTQENDSIETLAVKSTFGCLANQIPMSSIKSMMGHLIAAAGSVEFITCVQIIQTGIIPPTINLLDPDPDLDLDYVPNTARKMAVDICLSNSFGFGGQNDSLVIGAWKDV